MEKYDTNSSSIKNTLNIMKLYILNYYIGKTEMNEKERGKNAGARHSLLTSLAVTHNCSSYFSNFAIAHTPHTYRKNGRAFYKFASLDICIYI